jgi:hypothetical protein
MKTQKFGIEIEMTGLTRKKAAEIIAAHFGTTATYSGGVYGTYSVRDAQGRSWKLVSDASILTDGGEEVEMVSPICTYDDITTIQEIVRKLRKAGAKTNTSCGIHVHIDASAHIARSLKNLANIMVSKESLLFKALKVGANRERYCQKADKNFIERINGKRITDKDTLKKLWYNGADNSHMHYDESRYHALNLHSVWSKGTVEFRLYNGSLHAGEIKTYIQLSLAINHQALTQTSASYKETTTTNDKYTFRTWLLRMGLIGDEFETARHHLLKNLKGDIAWRNGNRAA